MDKYGHVLAPKSTHFRRHQMVQSFLWMQLNKEKDNQHSDRQDLVHIVAQSFNKRAYTGRKIIQWERCTRPVDNPHPWVTSILLPLLWRKKSTGGVGQ